MAKHAQRVLVNGSEATHTERVFMVAFALRDNPGGLSVAEIQRLAGYQHPYSAGRLMSRVSRSVPIIQCEETGLWRAIKP